MKRVYTSQKIELPKAKRTASFSLKVDADLLAEVKKIAEREGVSLTEVIEYGLGRYLEEMKGETK